MEEGKTPVARVTVLAGIPGAGKSHIADVLRERGADVLSTDDFWVDTDGYNFDPKRITEAHGWNLKRFIFNLRGSDRMRDSGVIHEPWLVVDNTNTTIAEIAPYVAIAQAYQAEVKIVAVMCPWEVAAKRQTHGVPVTKVYQMSVRLEETLRSFPSWWPLEVYDNSPGNSALNIGE